MQRYITLKNAYSNNSTHIMKSLFFIFCMLVWFNAQADSKPVTTVTPLILTDKNTKGYELRGQANTLIELVKSKKLDEAQQLAMQLRQSYEEQFNKNIKQYSFQSENEYTEFKKSSTEEFEWIDWGYKECLQMLAFIQSEKRNYQTAIEYLTKIEQIAPISSSALIETGYVLNQLHHYNDALAIYLKALDLSMQYSTQRPYKASIFRGIGFSFIELNELDEAEKAYQDALALEPTNQVALKELTYIQSLREANKAKKTP
ncbi:tetratricopeptide repeat protein [Methylomonas sp. AM2-LC]|uniref:tetratricopeptide repeat protein n=1 Tax=Methylomonas sp. AM2-LC TaxID=3153301 RepID=UPI00326546A2